MEKKRTKKGFTLVELVVVLAILAIVAAIAVPTAFGSIEKAKDAAAIASIESMGSLIRTARTLALADDEFQKQFMSKPQGAFIEYIDGMFKKIETPEVINNPYEDYMTEALNSSKLRVDKKAYFYIHLVESGKDDAVGYTVNYAPNGVKNSGGFAPQFTFPYYQYKSDLGTVKKIKADGTEEIIN